MKHPRHFFSTASVSGKLVVACLILTGAVGCGGKPDLALCGGYYRHVLQLHQGEHRAVLAALKTSQGKDAVIDYCMALEKFRVQCVLDASDPGSAIQCETGAEPTLMDGLRQRIDDFTE